MSNSVSGIPYQPYQPNPSAFVAQGGPTAAYGSSPVSADRLGGSSSTFGGSPYAPDASPNADARRHRRNARFIGAVCVATGLAAIAVALALRGRGPTAVPTAAKTEKTDHDASAAPVEAGAGRKARTPIPEEPEIEEFDGNPPPRFGMRG